MNTIEQFIMQNVPGLEWIIFVLIAHVVLSTIVHIKNKDFKISEWPQFLYMWLLFMAGIIAINGFVAVAATLTSTVLILPVASLLQALVYGMYFSYYLDNIFKHLNMMGLPVDPGLIETIKGLAAKIKGGE